MAQEHAAGRPRRHVLVLALVAVATLIGFFAVFAVWVNRQAVNTDNWAETSSELLESEAIREQIAAFLTDEAFAAYDVQAQLSQALPPRAAPLAGPIAGGLRNGAEAAINELLQRPRVQALWERANRNTQRLLLKAVEGDGEALSTTGGEVTLDLGEVLGQTAQQIGVGGRLAQKVPPGTAEITILKSDQLEGVQDAFNVLRKLPLVLTLLSLGLFATAVAVAGRRREALRSVGIGFLVIGIGALLARSVAGNAIVDALAKTEAGKTAAQDVWRIGTSQLVIAAEAMIGYGVAILIAAWVAGPMGWAVTARRWAAPYLRDAGYAFGAAAVLVVLVVAWGPTPATRNPIALIVFAGLLALGVEVLRRQTSREFP